jgi:hypothetical protein
MATPRYLITRVRYLCRVEQIARPFSRALSTALFTLASCVYARSPLVFAALPLAGASTTAGSTSAVPVKDRPLATTNSDATIQRGSIMRAANRITQTNRREWDTMNFLLFLAILCSGSWFLLSNAGELTNEARWANSMCSAAGSLCSNPQPLAWAALGIAVLWLVIKFVSAVRD